jgi:hypothetical protein
MARTPLADFFNRPMEATETSPDKLQGRPDTWTTRSICYENLQLAEFLFLHVL